MEVALKVGAQRNANWLGLGVLEGVQICRNHRLRPGTEYELARGREVGMSPVHWKLSREALEVAPLTQPVLLKEGQSHWQSFCCPPSCSSCVRTSDGSDSPSKRVNLPLNFIHIGLCSWQKVQVDVKRGPLPRHWKRWRLRLHLNSTLPAPVGQGMDHASLVVVGNSTIGDHACHLTVSSGGFIPSSGCILGES
jgi:hypothetical protein